MTMIKAFFPDGRGEYSSLLVQSITARMWSRKIKRRRKKEKWKCLRHHSHPTLRQKLNSSKKKKKFPSTLAHWGKKIEKKWKGKTITPPLPPLRWPWSHDGASLQGQLFFKTKQRGEENQEPFFPQLDVKQRRPPPHPPTPRHPAMKLKIKIALWRRSMIIPTYNRVVLPLFSLKLVNKHQ